MDGILNIYKERGYTSHDVVAKLRRICGQKKIGHTGTLDPEAEGVLPVCLGQATKVCDQLTDEKKVYEAVLLLGTVTDTEDIFGTVLQTAAVNVTEEEVRRTVLGFVGRISQIPPMYSARKVGGKKLYELARQGKVVEREAREVEIFSIDILSLALPEARIRICCSKGTYIRTLCHDIGESLGCGGCMKSLLRLRVGPFAVEESLKLGEVEEKMKEGRLSEVLLPPDRLFPEFPACTASRASEKMLYNGNTLPAEALSPRTESPRIRVYDAEGCFIGLYDRTEKGGYSCHRMFFGGRET